MRPDTSALARLLQTISLLACVLTIAVATPAQEECRQTITADVVALDQPFMFNRLGTSQPQGMIFALKRDVVNAATMESCDDPKAQCKAGQVTLRPDKRPRPIALRVNAGQCLQINFTNLIDPNPTPNSGLPATTTASLHLVGLELVPAREGRNPPQPGIDSDATYVGVNNDSQAVPNGKTKIYKYYAKAEGTFLAYSAAGDWAGQLQSGLFGAVTVEPEHAEWYRSQVTNEDLRLAAYYVKETSDRTKTLSVADHPELLLTREYNESGQPLTVTVEGQQRQVWTITSLQPSRQTIQTARVVVIDSRVVLLDGRPLVNYNALYPANHPRAGTPILRMLDATQRIVHTDLTALITGPNAGRFSYADNSPGFYEVPASPDRRQPFREFTVIYHEAFGAVQPFAQFYDTPLNGVLGANGSGAGTDTFAINYGMAGIAAEVLANRLGLGPMGNKDSVDLKYEEFFLSSWANGDPAMIVDVPANAPNQVVGTSATGTKVVNPVGAGGTPSFTQPPSNQKATRVFYPDDTSNVYHSYMRDHMKFRLLHGGGGITHIHHLHAQQWLHSPNSDDGHYLDSQMINPGSGYTLEMVHGGSGNRNLTVGDSIFHCHFYPHFASGMWSLWRVHDVFEAGTPLDKKTGQPVAGSRALPDGEIAAGVPIPAVVPLPTLAMAPPPARVRLTADGRRVAVEDLTTADGKRYRNPGFPFFVPGMAGHRAPHPPLDFAWEEDERGAPLLDANGQKRLLDGGLPRHLVLDGKIVREFHTRWDFTKDFILYKDGKPVDGGLVAFELPEGGTDVERAAMAAHAQRTHPSFQPNGDPGNFILNGLPPAHGAPYADPAVDDDGNARVNTRRYQAAAIQLNVVFNKKGWHFPQQRMLTLWNDVSPTVQGTRPPQPFFFRANTGETIEYWHTNLVPDYYELDDFQVRTPTDLLGQHIHLVKFDVTSSDGAGNGWNYEDGTFSPDEVRNRIDAINLSGGLHNFDTTTQFRGTRQTILKPKPASAIFGTPPAGQNWLGAQTTIQRWDTDPLLNNRGVDRTLRTVFTHDHFGPSTHQQIGLYGGLLVEPEGSKWFDPITGELFYDLRLRRDGGPTSWQADIRTFNVADSYREFALEFQDFQLAYTNLSPAPDRNGTPPSVPTSPLFNVCPNPDSKTQNCTVADIVAQLNQGGRVPPALSQSFTRNGITLSANAAVTVQSAGKTWQINNPLNSPKDNSTPSCNHPSVVCNRYPVALNADATVGLQVTNLDMTPGWSSAQTAINAPFDSANAASGAPYPMLISSVPMQGTFSLNYRNEPLPLRVNTQPANMLSTPAPSEVALTPAERRQASDLSFVFSSIKRLDRDLNRQPVLGGQIDPTCDPKQSLCFTFPKRPLVPEGGNGYFGQDPFTPLLRAYANDQVQIRTLVGAHHNPHYFNLHGVKWFKEPSHTTSGYRSSQTMGLSEHFEMLFRLPSATTTRTRPFADYLYQASAGTDGLTNGLWGIMRAYDRPVDKLMPLPNNPQAATPASANVPANADTASTESAPVAAAAIARAPAAGATGARKYHVVATTAAQALPAGTLVYNSRGQLVTSDPLTFAPQTNIENPYALIYVLAENLTSPTAAGKLKPGARIEPLILRAAAGEWIEITLTNAFDPSNVKTNATFTQTTPALSPFTQPTPVPTPAPPLPVIPLQTSTNAGLHPLLLAYDVSTSDGANVGFNPIQTVAPGESRKMYWYAGSLDERGRETPIELGTINLLPSDPLQQHPKGLVGALIVEPKGASWCEDANGSASVSVYMQSVRCEDIRRGSQKIKPAFREFVVITQDDLTLYSGSQSGVPQPYGATSSSVNNKTEPMSYRYPGGSTTGDDVSASQSNRQVQAEPQTPIFSATAGTPVRFRMLHPAGGPGADGNVISIDGHVWQEEPYVNDSREIGHNSESQWMGSRGQHGARSNIEIVLESAGGTYKVPGDYIYRSLIALLGGGDMQAGVWGIFRVLPPGRDAVYISQATRAGAQINVNGNNTINPDTGGFAPTNQLYAGGIDPRTQKCSGRPLLVPVLTNASDGSWKASIPGAQVQKVCVQSAYGGVQEITLAAPGVKPNVTALAAGRPLPQPIVGRRYRKNK